MFDPSLPMGHSKRELRHARKRWSLHGLVDVHHIIPKQFKGHPTVRKYGYNVEADYNFMFCVTKRGVQHLNIRDSRPIHDIQHGMYNLFVKQQLDSSTDYDSLLAVLVTLYYVCKGRKPSTWSSRQTLKDKEAPRNQ